jgi:methylenetetrahydrofolate dehydrogenase (NAD+)
MRVIGGPFALHKVFPLSRPACSRDIWFKRGEDSLRSRRWDGRIHRSFHVTSVDDRPSMEVDVSPLAKEMRQQVRLYTKAQRDPISMVGILADMGLGNHQRSDSETYSNMIQKRFASDGLHYTVHRCENPEPQDLERIIEEYNHRSDIQGIMVFYPIFPQRAAGFRQPHNFPYYLDAGTGVYYKTVDDYIRDCVIPSKDVEGVSYDSTLTHGKLPFRARGHRPHPRLPNDVYIPCTVTAILKVLETYHLSPLSLSGSMSTSPSEDIASSPLLRPNRWKNCTVTVVNRSTILGRPLAALLAWEGATVFSVDEDSILQFQSGGSRVRRFNTGTLNDCVQQSSVVVTAVPNEAFQLDVAAIADYTTVVNVSEYNNVDSADMLEQKRGIRYISSVGKVTVAALEHNLIRLQHASSLSSPMREEETSSMRLL